MFLSSLTSSDPRFKTLHFREGLNILVADRTETSEQGDSRNSIGKTSFVKVLKYVLGGDLASEFKVPELAEHSFTATLSLPSADDEVVDEVTVTRAVSPATRVRVLGWSATGGATDLHVDEWRELLSRSVFRIPEDASRPTAGQIGANSSGRISGIQSKATNQRQTGNPESSSDSCSACHRRYLAKQVMLIA